MKDSNFKKCPNCNSFVSIEDRFCRVCGHDFSKDEDYSSEGKTFEDFLLEASKYRSESQIRRNKLTIDDVKSSENNNTNYDKKINNHNQDTTDRLSVSDIESESELLKEQRKKAFEETNNDYYNDNEYYEYEDDEKSSIFKKIILSVIGVALLIGIVFGVKYIKPMFQENLAEKTITAESVKGKFIQSVQTKSSEQMMSIVKSSNQSVPFRNKDAEEFINEINSNPEYQATILKWLEDDEANLKSDKSYKSTNPLKMVKENDGYKILIDPIKLTIENPENAKLSLENASEYAFPGKKILLIESNDLTLRQNYDLSFFSKNSAINWDIVDINKTLPDFDVTSGEKNYEIRKTIDDDCLVFVNDKNTGLTTDKFNEKGRKNLTEDQDFVRMVAKGKNGLLKSPKQTVGWETWVRLYLKD
ncbi:MAG: zinc ribbon domain-containing protein [Finegoldia magna]|uniref:zinc ribbon domain-containing protein n=1 Tax=Finegoldia magna TaxID=1260 RepID=UPI00290745E9|nr:zinc ribbon domain-containing protein [Finegoldia magna]MDU7478447.1 zinc ribbon domain-containing protein [Finegoldia magna]MDU7501382.1 zinc ribbon domain-containing protein [Finegoldia magna]